MAHATLYVYTDIDETNGHIDVFAHLLTTGDDDRYTDVDYGRHTYVGYSRWEAVNQYITKVVGTSIKDGYNINIKTF